MFSSDNGGGFFQPGASNNNSQFQGGFQTQSNRANADGGNFQRNQQRFHFNPVTLKMIEDGQTTPDDQLEVDGMRIQNVSIIGRLLEESEESMRTILEMSDGTSTFKVIFYKKGENELPTALKNFTFKQSTWVKVKGTVRIFKEDKAIVGNQIDPIEQHDEVVNHFLQVFVAHNIRHKGVLSHDQLSDSRARQRQSAGGVKKNGAQDVNLLQIMQQLMKRNNMKFIDKNSITQECRGKLSAEEVEAGINQLQDDGIIYSAMNENVFALTEDN